MMERMWLGVLYFSGWSILSTCLLYQYHFVPDEKNWNEAQTYCRNTYTDLATIENAEGMKQLMDTLSSAGYHSEVWIGLYMNIDWRWSDGYKGSGADYRNWQRHLDNEPNFWYGDQFCVYLGKEGAWYDDCCIFEHPFICFNGTQLDPDFFHVSEAMNWTNAQRYCRENFIDLATVKNIAENQKILNLMSPNQAWAYPAWIGLFRHPDIYWSDGSGFSFNNWEDCANPLGSASELCGVAALQNSGQWRVIPCETRLPFVCYSIPPPTPVKRQIVKLRMKLDSSVDPNDPAVKAELLKQLQDRLKEEGMSGVTLKWREQPDGKVFHKEGKSSPKEKREKYEF